MFYARKDYYMEKLKEHSNDQKRFWKELWNILPNKIKNNFNSIYNDSNVLLENKDA